MARHHSAHTRHKARSHPQGVLHVATGGFGFVTTMEGEFFVPASKMRGAFDGDVVEVARISDEHSKHAPARDGSIVRKKTGRVVRVVDRAHHDIVGAYHVVDPFGIVVPEDPRIRHDVFTQLSDYPEIPDGAIVRVEITQYPSRNTAATGRVVEVMGDEDDERVPIDLIVARHKLETTFSDVALVEAQACALDVDAALADGYRDIRDRFTFTVDPADARDFDDAVSLERVEDGWRLGVHIADVSRYVPWASALDENARRRATSVYLVDRVIPMLPEQLSNDLCSLRPDEDRLCLSVDVVIDGSGRAQRSEVYAAVMRSDTRLTYDQAQRLLDDGRATGIGPALEADLVPRLRELSRIADARAALRKRVGGIDFDTTEARVRLDQDGVPVAIEQRRKTPATMLIEEAMILANETVAQTLEHAGFPCLYRVHESPDHDNLKGLAFVFDEFPWFRTINRAKFEAGDPFAIVSALEKSAGRPEEPLVTSLVLRSMKRAVYSPEHAPHYALASGSYCHFTSPIRRYPDLVVHRMLKAYLFGRPEKFDQERSALPWIAEHASEMERVADAAARESQESKIIELMEVHIGETFSAMIAGVAPRGLFVRLENSAEGLVSIDDLGNEYFALDSVRHTLTGAESGRVFRLGQHVAVVLVSADRLTRHLDFRLVRKR